MRRSLLLRGALLFLVLLSVAPQQVVAQAGEGGRERRVVRLSVGAPGDYLLGFDAEFGRTAHTSTVASMRVWKFGSHACVNAGPIEQPDGSVLPTPPGPPCIPDGWSVSAGLRGRMAIFFAEADLGLYRYNRGQTFLTPYGGLRTGIAPAIGSRLELQVGLHLILISSYNSSGFDPASWFLGAWEVGLGIPVGR